MARIFISYSRKDEAFGRRLATSLSQMGADVWIDIEDIPTGMKWSRAIQEGLDISDVLLVLISPDSMASGNVEDEWQYYLDQRKPIIPILLLPAKMHFQLSRMQYIDFNRQAYDKALSQLHAELGRKGVHLNPLPKHATPTVPISHAPIMPAAPSQPRGRSPLIWIGLIGVVLVVGIALGLLASNANNGRTDTPTNPPIDAGISQLPTTDPGQQIDPNQQIDQQTIPTGLPLGPYDNSAYNANGVQFTYPQGWPVENIDDAGTPAFITANSQAVIDFWKSDSFSLDNGLQPGQVAVTILPHAEQLYQSGAGLTPYDAVSYFETALASASYIAFDPIQNYTVSGASAAVAIGAGTTSSYAVEIMVIDLGASGLVLIFGAAATDQAVPLINAIDGIASSISVSY
jgi:hypothetical protein